MPRKSAVLRKVLSSSFRGIKKLGARKRVILKRRLSRRVDKPSYETESCSDVATATESPLSVNVHLEYPSDSEYEHVEITTPTEVSSMEHVERVDATDEGSFTSSSFQSEILDCVTPSKLSSRYSEQGNEDPTDAILEELFDNLMKNHKQELVFHAPALLNSRRERLAAASAEAKSSEKLLEEVLCKFFDAEQSAIPLDCGVEFTRVDTTLSCIDEFSSSEPNEIAWNESCEVIQNEEVESSYLDDCCIEFTPSVDLQQAMFLDVSTSGSNSEPKGEKIRTTNVVAFLAGIFLVLIWITFGGVQSAVDMMNVAQLQLIAVARTGKLRPHSTARPQQRKPLFLSTHEDAMGVWLSL